RHAGRSNSGPYALGDVTAPHAPVAAIAIADRVDLPAVGGEPGVIKRRLLAVARRDRSLRPGLYIDRPQIRLAVADHLVGEQRRPVGRPVLRAVGTVEIGQAPLRRRVSRLNDI